MDTQETNQVKIAFDLEPSDFHYHSSETLWANYLGDDNYQLDNTPIFAYGVSYGDIVEAKKRTENDFPRYIRTIKNSGHSTYRIIILNQKTISNNAAFDKYWEPLKKLGCSYEGFEDYMLAVDVPLNADINEAYSLLEKGETDGVWSFEEGHCGHNIEV